MSLSEKLFILFIAGSLFAVVSSFSTEESARGRAGQPSREEIHHNKMLAYLTHASTVPVDAAHGRPGLHDGTGIGRSGAGGVIVAQADAQELAELLEQIRPTAQVPGASLTPSRVAAVVQRAGPPGGAHLRRQVKAARADSVSVFTPSRLGLRLHRSRGDVWGGWKDVNRRNIGGTQGVAALGAAFDLVAKSRISFVTDDLYRKGIKISFGTQADFSGEMGETVAYFDFPPNADPADGVPPTLPEIKFNPAFVREHPQVLASALVHEATHFQQFLEGSLIDATTDDMVDLGV